MTNETKVLCINLLFLSACASLLIVKEGENCKFAYNVLKRGSVKMSLFFEHYEPFWRSGNASNHSFTPFDRFLVVEYVYDSMINVQIEIQNVSRVDAGTYTLRVLYGIYELKVHRQRITIKVESPPAKASCKVSESPNLDNESANSQIIECTAPKGNIRGCLTCFQKGGIINSSIRSQRSSSFILELNVPNLEEVRCCASDTWSKKLEMNCKEFRWEADEQANSSQPKNLEYTKFGYLFPVIMVIVRFILF